jgi:hypothetical protein
LLAKRLCGGAGERTVTMCVLFRFLISPQTGSSRFLPVLAVSFGAIVILRDRQQSAIAALREGQLYWVVSYTS